MTLRNSTGVLIVGFRGNGHWVVVVPVEQRWHNCMQTSKGYPRQLRPCVLFVCISSSCILYLFVYLLCTVVCALWGLLYIHTYIQYIPPYIIVVVLCASHLYPYFYFYFYRSNRPPALMHERSSTYLRYLDLNHITSSRWTCSNSADASING